MALAMVMLAWGWIGVGRGMHIGVQYGGSVHMAGVMDMGVCVCVGMGVDADWGRMYLGMGMAAFLCALLLPVL